MKKILLLVAILLAMAVNSQTKIDRKSLKAELKQEILAELDKKEKVTTPLIKRFELKGYGVLNYYNYKWDTDTEKRNAVDAERLNFYFNYKFNDRIRLKTELEIEHGGTGVTK